MRHPGFWLLGLLAAGLLCAHPLLAAQLQVLLPLGRTAYQTNEFIDVAVVRSDTQALPADLLTMLVTGEDGSKVTLTFPLQAVALTGAVARTTEHYHLNGWLLRPGNYTLEVTAHGAAAQAKFSLHSHLRRSTFRLLEWGSRAKGEEQALLGEDSVGFNMNYTMYGGIDRDAMIRGGVDYMPCCTLGGAHQIGMRLECDWSDPYVLQGAVVASAGYEALKQRTAPNCLGIHFYDEPGLTWLAHQKTGVQVPFNIPAQDRAYKSAFGEEAPQYNELKDNPALAEKWWQMARWKESFMEAAWKLASDSVRRVNPNFISATQSVYGFWANTDGYYFNIARSLPMISGHGGYSDWGPGYFHPSLTHEFGRLRDLEKPNWYLPAWNGGMPANQLRLEQYLSFMTNLQGMMIPPDQQVHKPYNLPAAEGIVESNKTMGRLGTIFTTMPVTRSEVAVLYSMSQLINSQVTHLTKGDNPNTSLSGDGHNLEKLGYVYIAGKLAHIPLFPIVEEDILDGTLAANHKALLIYSTDYLEPRVTGMLEQFIANGGAVLVTDDSTVRINGATRLGAAVNTELSDNIGKAMAAKDDAALAKYNNVGAYMDAAMPLAKALTAKLAAVGITPVLDVETPSVIVARQAQGDIEYFFTVNATWDAREGKTNSIKPATSVIRFPADGRPVYDAVRGGSVPELTTDAEMKMLVGTFSYGAGAMRVFTRTARPIGGVQVATPVVRKELTAAQEPLRVTLSATLVDSKGALLVGAAPLQIRLIDPLKAVRYDLYRATRNGVCTLALPLAINDPAGVWTVEVTELLNNSTGTAAFTYRPAAQCGALAGATPRAVYFGNERENIFRFFRTHQDVAIVKGISDYCAAAAERLAESLRPWGIRCTIVAAAEVNKPRELPADAKATWAPPYGGYRFDAGKATPGQVGYVLTQSAILLGTPEDNPLIKAAMQQPYNSTLLPYAPNRDTFPGTGRGYLAWQSNFLGFNGQESITGIAYDAPGMSEAIGTLYEAATGLDPLMSLTPPALSTVTPAAQATLPPAMTIAWQANLPDRAATITAASNGQLEVATIDGTLTTLDAVGTVAKQQATPVIAPASIAAPKIPDTLKAKLVPMRIAKFVVPGETRTVIAYWGGTLQVFAADGTLLAQQLLPQDINALAWSDTTLVVGLADGRVVALK